jgi:hypothetical protein
MKAYKEAGPENRRFSKQFFFASILIRNVNLGCVDILVSQLPQALARGLECQ